MAGTERNVQRHAEKRRLRNRACAELPLLYADYRIFLTSCHSTGGENMRKEERSNMVKREVKDRLFRFLFEKDKRFM